VVLAGSLVSRWFGGGKRGIWLETALCGIGITGTVAVVLVPPLRVPAIALLWTFLLLCIVSAVFYLDLLGALSGRRMAALLGFRVVVVGLLVLMLFNPVQRCIQPWQPQRPLFFLIDTSGSMSFADVQNGPTRIQSVWQAIQPLQDKIARHFIPHYFTFAGDFHEINALRDLATIRADGTSTDIRQGLIDTLSRASRGDAAIILLSDGIDNVSANVVDAVRDSSHPINTVIVGSDQTEQATIANIAVEDVAASEDFVVGHETTVTATIKSSALANRVVDVKLAELDAAGKPIEPIVSTKLVLQPIAAGQTVKLAYTPHGAGVHRITVWVDPVPGEQNLLDNRQEFQGLAIDPRIRLLYIEGRLRPEYRYLNRALQRDPNVELATLLRIAATRFAASGSVDGAPFTGMPTSAPQWDRFDVIILGDLDSSFLPPAAQIAIEQRIANGGGLLMIGGQNSFGPGGYAGTPIERALPVLVGGGNDAAQELQEFVPSLTADGLAHSALEGLAPWFGGAAAATTSRPVGIPPLRGNVIVAAAKSGAQVLLIHPGRPGPGSTSQIVLAAERYGKGRSAAFTVDTTYLWDLPLYGLGQDSPYNKLWAQLVRWLAGTDVRNRQKGAGIEGLLNKNIYQLGESVRVRALVRDERGDATQFAQVILKLKQRGATDEQTLTLAPVESHIGMYETIVSHPNQGHFTGELVATKDAKELGRQTLAFEVIPPAQEMLKIAANPRLMGAIADATHGSYVDLASLGALIDELIAADPNPPAATQRTIAFNNLIRAIPQEFGTETNWDRKYDLPMQGGLVAVFLAAEWVLRRRWQLP